jgi:hypothetical protein
MRSTREVVDRVGGRFPLPDDAFDRLERRRNRKRRNQRIAAGSVGMAVFVALIWIVTTVGSFDRTQTPAGPAEETQPAGSAEEPDPPGRVQGAPPASGVPKVDYVIDLKTDVMTPLPETIIRTAGETADGSWPTWLRTPRSCSGGLCGDARYVASPDGSLLAYVGTGDEGTPQIFIAGIDGTGVRQMTHEPMGATSPAWSPDGTMIAYARIGSTPWEFTGILLDVATGESTQVTVDGGIGAGLQFTPDGASLLYSVALYRVAGEIRTVPIAGGGSTLLIGPEGDAPGDLAGVGEGSMSPDGSLVTFTGPTNDSDVGRWVANADGTGRRALPGCYDAIPAGTWSRNGSRIVCNESYPPTYAVIMVIDVATGDARRVARGVSATWLDDHTLLVEV